MSFRLLLILSLIVRILFYVFFFNQEAWNIHMLLRFDERALAVASGTSISNFAAWGSYPVLLGAFYWCLDALGLLEYRLNILFWMNQGLALGVAWMAYRTLRAFQGSEGTAKVFVSLFLLFNPVQIYVSGMNMSEGLFQTATMLSLMALLKVGHWKPSLRWSVFWLGLAIAYLARNIIIPFLISVPVLLYWTWKSEGKSIFKWPFATGALLAGGLLLLVSFVNTRLDSQGKGALNLNRGANLVQTWCEAPVLDFKTPESSFWFSPPIFWNEPVTRSLYLAKDFSETANYTLLAAQCLQEDPWRLLFHLRSLLNVFDGPLYPDPLKISEGPLVRVYGGLYLVLFLFVLAGMFQRPLQPRAVILLWFVLSQLLAVYAGNVGEARFVYSFLPALVVLAALMWQQQGVKRRVLSGLGAAAWAVALWQVPPLPKMIEDRAYSELSKRPTGQVLDLLRERRSVGPDRVEVCDVEWSPVRDCLGPQSGLVCQNEKVFAWLKELSGKALSEQELFCRNLAMVQLRNRSDFDFSAAVIQAPAPLPGGVQAGHTLVGISGQMLQVELLQLKGASALIPAGEEYTPLLHQLLKYQHRLQHNRPEYRGTVVDSLSTAEPSDEAARIYHSTLSALIESLQKFPDARFPQGDPK